MTGWFTNSQYMALWFPCCCCCCYSVTKSCPALCDPMDCSMPGSSVLPEFAQIISIIYTALTYSFPNFEPVHCSMCSSNCWFLSCIQVSQEAGKMVWYSHLFKNFPQFVVSTQSRIARRSSQSILKEISPGVHWKDWCWSWNSNTLATSCEELTHWKRPWCWEGLGAGGEGDDRGWDGWMASPTQWTWVWVNSRSLWWTGRPVMLRFMGSQRVGQN